MTLLCGSTEPVAEEVAALCGVEGGADAEGGGDGGEGGGGAVLP
eukprot:COSAG01_NODE_27818_length_676_cov_0.908146_1_plen_44_part_00